MNTNLDRQQDDLLKEPASRKEALKASHDNRRETVRQVLRRMFSISEDTASNEEIRNTIILVIPSIAALISLAS